MPTANIRNIQPPKEAFPAINTDDIAFIQDFLTCKTMPIHSAGAIRIIEKNLTF